jgi:hypothetical protein
MDEKTAGIAIVLVSGIFFIGFTFLMFLLFKKTIIMRNVSKEQKKAHKEKLLSLGAIDYIYAAHVTGLPIAQGAACSLYLCEDKIVFERNERSSP